MDKYHDTVAASKVTTDDSAVAAATALSSVVTLLAATVSWYLSIVFGMKSICYLIVGRGVMQR